jgi:hypothetical protein
MYKQGKGKDVRSHYPGELHVAAFNVFSAH